MTDSRYLLSFKLKRYQVFQDSIHPEIYALSGIAVEGWSIWVKLYYHLRHLRDTKPVLAPRTVPHRHGF